MKMKFLLVSSLAAISLAACQSNDVEENHSSKETTHSEQASQKEQTTNNPKTSATDSEVKQPASKVDKLPVQEHQHEHKEDDKNALKAEDIVVTYFNAITSGDIKTVEKLYPSAVEENNQLTKLFENSKVATDIVDMKKLSLNDSKAEYQVDVKLYTKTEDNNFTNNTSKYVLQLDLTKGIITSKAITSTDYLE